MNYNSSKFGIIITAIIFSFICFIVCIILTTNHYLNQPEQTKQPKKYIEIEQQATKHIHIMYYKDYHESITVADIDSCEYIISNNNCIIHKQNCKYCANRK